MDWSFLNVDERHSIMELTGWSTKKLTGSKKEISLREQAYASLM